MATDPAVVRAFQTQSARARDAAAARTEKLFARLVGTNLEESAVAAFAEAAAAATADVRILGAELAEALASDALDRDLGLNLARILAAADDAEVWRQPFISGWQALASGHNFDHAVEVARLRAGQVGRDEVTRAVRSTMSAVDARHGARIGGWRRSPNGGACDWCHTVARQRYKSAASADFGHDDCHCAPVPIVGADPGRFL